MEIKELSIEQLVLNKENCNKMSDENYQKLKAEIKRNGGPDLPLVVAPLGDKFFIVDGNHRAVACLELGINSIGCIIKEWDEVEQRIRGLNLNYLRGQAVPVKLADLLYQLNKTVTLQDLSGRLPYDEKQLKETMELLKVPQDIEKLMKNIDKDHLVEVNFVLNPDKQETIGDFIKACYKFASMSGVKIADVKTSINELKETIAVVSFKVSEPVKQKIELALAYEMQGMDGKNKTGRALEIIVDEYLSKKEVEINA